MRASSSVLAAQRVHRLAFANGLLWSLGNGLVSTQLVVYLAMALGTKREGLGVSLILAAPALVGLLRLATPMILDRLADRKTFCIAAYAASAAVLMLLPLLAAPSVLGSAERSLAALVALWAVYHLCEYAGTIALWSWLADLVPREVRGLFIGRRERWIAAGAIGSLLAAAAFNPWWNANQPDAPRWLGYAVLAAPGAAMMALAVVPLTAMPRVLAGRVVQQDVSLAALLRPLADRRFLVFLAYAIWSGLANGVDQASQYRHAGAIGIALSVMLGLRLGMRGGQWAISPTLGWLADRLGNRRVMIVCGLFVAQGPLFYYLATPARPWWIVGAWIVWIAYAGLNVGLPNYLLKLAPRETNTPYIALYFAAGGLAYAVSTAVFGWLSDGYRDRTFVWLGAEHDYTSTAFLAGWLARMGSVVLLACLVEPRSAEAS